MFNFIKTLNLIEKYFFFKKIPLVLIDSILFGFNIKKNCLETNLSKHLRVLYLIQNYNSLNNYLILKNFSKKFNRNTIHLKWFTYNFKNFSKKFNLQFFKLKILFNYFYFLENTFNSKIINNIHYFISSKNNSRKRFSSTKTRSKVSGSGRKLWKQKGTGRARRGSIRSPLTRSGGISFGPKPRSIFNKINKKFILYLKYILMYIKNINLFFISNNFISYSKKNKKIISKNLNNFFSFDFFDNYYLLINKILYIKIN